MFLSIVIPCYNEASRGSLEDRLDSIRLAFCSEDYEVIIVDDCSKDNSYKVISDYIKRNNLSDWSVVTSEKNGGKGVALRKGFALAGGSYTLMMDADLSVDLKVVPSLLESVRKDVCIIGNRYLDDSKIVNNRSFLRKLLSKIARWLIGASFKLGVSDTQCGFKLFPTDKLKRCTSYVGDGWLYDVELLYCMRVQGVSIKELPVRWVNMEKESTLKPLQAGFDCLMDLVLLHSKRGSIDEALSE